MTKIITDSLLQTLKTLLQSVNARHMSLDATNCYFISDPNNPIPENARRMFDSTTLDQRLSKLPFCLYVDNRLPHMRTLFIDGKLVAQSSGEDELKEIHFSAHSSYLRGQRKWLQSTNPAHQEEIGPAIDLQAQRDADAFILRYMADRKLNNGK